MNEYAQWLERQYEAMQKIVTQLSMHWREHGNRRTLVLLIIFGTLIGATYLFAIRAPDAFPTGELVSIDEGQSVSQIATSLQQASVIRSPLLFRIVVTILGRERQLHAGDYLFKQPIDVFAVARAVALGEFGLEPFKIRVPEGATTKEMAIIFSRELERFNSVDFMAKAQPQEGYLFPDTYFFLPNATADTVIIAMRQNFDTEIASAQSDIASSTHSLSDIVIMASILEREGRNLQDRQLIAGVLWRRIRLGMALQADATMIYTLDRGEAVTPKVLATKSPYNTYLNKGLPPTPIGSPSRSSLQAAADPIDKGYLFYLADSSGVTHFSKTYAGQLANERRYFGR